MNQKDKEGYKEGKRTGYDLGYQRGLKDALLVVQTMLAEHNMILRQSEFELEYENLVDEGEIDPRCPY